MDGITYERDPEGGWIAYGDASRGEVGHGKTRALARAAIMEARRIAAEDAERDTREERAIDRIVYGERA